MITAKDQMILLKFIIVGTLADKNGWKICEIMKWHHEILNFYCLKQQMYT